MMEDSYFILMADIVDSRKTDQHQLMIDFKEIVTQINTNSREILLSPLTITLGDEFQSVATGLSAALSIILQLEESIILKGKDFKLRYVLTEGKIETEINNQVAYEMLGSGLTQARENLAALKNSKSRFLISIKDQALGKAITNTFVAFQDILDRWKPEKDYYIVAEFMLDKDYKQIAHELNKERSLIWKREKSLNLEEYFALKEVITYLGKTYDA